VKIFDASGDGEVITTETLEIISRLPDFAKLDKTLGSWNILGNDEIKMRESKN
jgi:hypothetical protein